MIELFVLFVTCCTLIAMAAWCMPRTWPCSFTLTTITGSADGSNGAAMDCGAAKYGGSKECVGTVAVDIPAGLADA